MHHAWRGEIGPGKVQGCIMRPDPNDTVPIVGGPEKVVIIVAGGPGLHSVFSTSGIHSCTMVTKEIKLPGNWGDLLERAKPHTRKRP